MIKAPAKKTAAKKAPVAKKAPAAKRAASTIAVSAPPAPVALPPHGKVMGRPKIERDPLEQVQTRIPAPMNDYLKLLALSRLPDQPAPFKQVQVMFVAMFERFLAERPWEHGLPWREPQAIVRFEAGEIAERTVWRQVNIRMPKAMVTKVKRAAKAAGRSEASYCYTAISWWTQFLYPQPVR
jgi:hypothetical protein